jgi:hypothetical protein
MMMMMKLVVGVFGKWGQRHQRERLAQMLRLNKWQNCHLQAWSEKYIGKIRNLIFSFGRCQKGKRIEYQYDSFSFNSFKA